jgi:hypothetical protein
LPDELLSEVLARITPSAEEERHVRNVAREVIDKVDSAARAEGLDVYAVHVGSTARDTWLKGKKDIDIFLMFPPGGLWSSKKPGLLTPPRSDHDGGLEFATPRSAVRGAADGWEEHQNHEAGVRSADLFGAPLTCCRDVDIANDAFSLI